MAPSEATSRQVILVVEDDPITLAMVARYLDRFGYEVLQAGDCAAARTVLANDGIDLALIDIRLPDGSGLDLAREIRERSQIGLIFITVMSNTTDRVLGLELGADDYITKPLELPELLARVRSTLRRVPAAVSTPGTDIVRLGRWEIDLRRREAVAPDGDLAPLTRAEFDVVAALVHAAGEAVSRDYLLDVISLRSAEITERTVDTLISRIRRKLEPGSDGSDLIKTVRGFGYRAAPEAL